MSIWLELHCDVPHADVDKYASYDNRCWSFEGRFPSGMAGLASKIPAVLRIIGTDAKKQGWKKNRHGWACPTCVKNGYMAREEN